MNKWKILFLIFAPVLIILCGVLLYFCLDTAVSLGYLQDSYSHLSQDFDIVHFIAENKEYTRLGIENELKSHSLTYFHSDGDSLFLNNITLVFKMDSLNAIKIVNSY